MKTTFNFKSTAAELLVDDLHTVRDANGRSRTRIIDPDVDLARARDGLLLKPWILPLENNR